MYKILVVEDSQDYQKIISRALGDFNLTCIDTAEAAVVLVKNQNFDLVLVDITLPQNDGYFLLSEMRASPELRDTPVLCLTGRKETRDKVTAFSLGADDYITKPFDPIELHARVDAKLKKTRQKKDQGTLTIIGDVEIDHSRHRVSILADSVRKEVDITQTEFKILCCLAKRPEQVFSRDQLLVAAWGEDATVLDRVVDAHICLLRKKMGSHGRMIKSVTGVGYKMTLQAVKKKTA